MSGTIRVEVSTDGVNWQPALLRSATAPVSPPDPRLLAEGLRWCAIHEPGKAVRWVAVPDLLS